MALTKLGADPLSAEAQVPVGVAGAPPCRR